MAPITLRPVRRSIAAFVVFACMATACQNAAPTTSVAESSEEPTTAIAAVEPTAVSVSAEEPTAVPFTATSQEIAIWQEQGHRSAIAHVVADRFRIDTDPQPLGQLLYSDDPGAAQALDDCFETEIRAALGDETIDLLNQSNYGDALTYWSEGSAALLRCAPTEVVRSQLLAAAVAHWNLYGPPGFDVMIQDACVQAIHPVDGVAFADQWTQVLRSIEGSCVDSSLQSVIAPPSSSAGIGVDGVDLSGVRGLTMQWISWEPEDWGQIEFSRVASSSTGAAQYRVDGRQDGPDGSRVVIWGTVTHVSETELRLHGGVATQVPFIDDGAVCVRSGTIQFLATGDRQFWRMQDLLNCDRQTTDYVDIYFG